MRVLVSGSSGLVGKAVVAELARRQHVVSRLVRLGPTQTGDVLWDPLGERFDAAAARGADAVVHLAAENVASRRWSEEQKHRIRDSRVIGTRRLARSLLGLEPPPRVIVSASAVGFYGNTGDRAVDESEAAGAGFLAEVCQEWEEATAPLDAAGVRVVRLRIGIVLSPQGGALARMLPIFRLGLGGRLGDGRQWMSWISLDDLAGVIAYAIEREALRGPVNAVSPGAVTNAEFTRTLGALLGRPTLFPAPAFALRLALGEMADEMLLASARVVPKALLDVAYEYRHRALEPALRDLLARQD